MPFSQCSSSVVGSLNPLLWSSKWMLAALPHHKQCTKLHRSAYLDQNWYSAVHPRYDRKILHRDELYVNMYIWPANWWFEKVELRKWYRLGRVVCQAEVQSALECTLCIRRVEVNLLLCVSSLSADSWQCHIGKTGSRMFGFDEALQGVFVLQSLHFYAQQTQHPASSVLGPPCMVSYWDILFPLW